MTLSRRILTWGIALSLGACVSTPTYIPAVTTVSGFDFTEFTKQGFMFTTESYAGRYESVGLLSVTMYPAARLVITEDPNREAPIREWIYDALPLQDVLKQAHERATAMGANAIINFSARSISRSYGTVQISGVELTGFAIRRTDLAP